MKSMGVKKLVALGVAAAIAAVPVAHAAQTFNTSALPTSKDWYLESVVVVGHASAPSDAVWAGNIAAAIASMAYEEETKTVTADITDAKVKLSVSGQIVIGEEGYAKETDVEFDDNTDPGQVTVGHVEAPELFRHEKITYTYDDGSGTKEETITVQDGVAFNANFVKYRDADADAEYPVLEVDNLEYFVEFSPGIKVGLDRDKNDLELTIPIFGEEYVVSKIGNDGSITFITAGEEVTINVGEEYEFQGHTVKLVDISEDGETAWVSVDGVSEEIEEGKAKTINGVKVYVKSVFNGVTVDSATLSLGAEEKTYHSGDQWKDMENWQIVIQTDNTGSPTYVTGIKIRYVGPALTGEDALKEGDKFQIADSDLYISFYGHDDYVKKVIEFDTDSVKVPYYSAGTVDLKYKVAVTVNDGETKTIDLGDVELRVKNEGGTVKITHYRMPGMTEFENFNKNHIVTQTNNDEILDNSGDTLTINIDRDTSGEMEIEYSVSVNVSGTDADVTFEFKQAYSNSDYVVSKDRKDIVKVKKDTDVIQVYTDKIDDTTFEYIEVPVDGQLNIDPQNNKIVKYVYGSTGSDYAGYNPESCEEFYTEEFDKVELSETKVKIHMGVKPAKAYVWVGTPAEEGEQENVYEKGIGETITIGDYEVKIEDIIAEGATVTYTVVKPKEIDRLVYLDNEVPTGKNLIVVGGYYVNRIAEAIAEKYPEIKDAVSKEDDYIVDKYEYNGREAILVFGYTAEDTAEAAQRFLDWLKANVK